MITFRFKKNICVDYLENDSYILEFNFKKYNKTHAKDTTYCSTRSNFYKIKQVLEVNNLEHIIEVVDENPSVVDISFHKNQDYLHHLLLNRRNLRVAIVNGISCAVGDFIVGMQAYKLWKRKLDNNNVRVNVDLLQTNPLSMQFLNSMISGDINGIRAMPIKLSELEKYDVIIDLSDFAARSSFYSMNLFDFFLDAFSIDFMSVDDTEKRIDYNIPNDILFSMKKSLDIIRKKNNNKLIMLHHISTTFIRSIPDDVFRSFVEKLLSETNYSFIITSPIYLNHHRIVNFSSFMPSLFHFISIIANVDGIITVDTCTYHLADKFSIPTVVLFTTIPPQYRIKYYPYTFGIMLEKQDGILYNKNVHSSNKKIQKEEESRVRHLFSDNNFDIMQPISLLERIL